MKNKMISHLVRFLVLGSFAAWEHDDRLCSEAHEK